MKDFSVFNLTKKLVVRYSNQQAVLPLDIQQKIDVYWNELIQNGKSYKRGEVFTVTKKEKSEDHIEILVEKTDYAHYLYSQDVGDLGECNVRIIHTAALVVSADGKVIFGEMGDQTSRAGVIQLCGGGIDNDDLRGDIFDFEYNITKELQEELGIDVTDVNRVAELKCAYFKEGGPTDKMTVVYRVELTETAEEFVRKYETFVKKLSKKRKQSEFGKIITLSLIKADIASFFQKNKKCDEYMEPLFNFLVK